MFVYIKLESQTSLTDNDNKEIKKGNPLDFILNIYKHSHTHLYIVNYQAVITITLVFETNCIVINCYTKLWNNFV